MLNSEGFEKVMRVFKNVMRVFKNVMRVFEKLSCP
jgi:hypothetical protein